MQTAKTFLILLALGLCVVPVSQARPDTEAQAKAREALRKKIAELNAQGNTVPGAPASGFADPATLSTGTAPATPEQAERQRESTRRKIAELNAQGDLEAELRAQEKAAAAEKRRLAEEEKARQKAEAEAAAKPAPFPPIPAPPSSLPASKDARLAELLKKYKADEITPEQYHTERAKIIAEP